MLKPLLEYNYVANQKFIKIIEHELPVDERLVELMSHILNAQNIWNHRMLLKSAPVEPWSIMALEDFSMVNDRVYQESCSIMSSKEHLHLIGYENGKGQGFENTIRDVLNHIVNHGTYHRGQLSMKIRELGFQPPATDYIRWKREE